MNRANRLLSRILWILLGLLLLAVCGRTVWENLTIGVTYYTITSDRLPAAFDGYTIVQVSDVHNGAFAEAGGNLLPILQAENPDLITITGDLVDSNRPNPELAWTFAAQAAQIAPCYFVTGNHEARLGAGYGELERELTAAGVTILHGEVTDLWKDNERIQVAGLDDPEYSGGNLRDQPGILETQLKQLNLQDDFTLLLSHRPEAFSVYTAYSIDLVLSGHAHGGQVRLPGVGGILAPHQGLFPTYDSGVYQEGTTAMVVSRGIGNSTFPVRVNNQPEVVVIRLRSGAHSDASSGRLHPMP